MSRYYTEIVSGTGIPPRRKPFALLDESGITINGLVRTVTGAQAAKQVRKSYAAPKRVDFVSINLCRRDHLVKRSSIGNSGLDPVEESYIAGVLAVTCRLLSSERQGPSSIFVTSGSDGDLSFGYVTFTARNPPFDDQGVPSRCQYSLVTMTSYRRDWSAACRMITACMTFVLHDVHVTLDGRPAKYTYSAEILLGRVLADARRVSLF
ncbi:hypothetical protein HD553DRAFT_324572 [Filobasidium floriforme]|uniref:uncharacterized protein n=1 Tax=Filobasidium floriforme TaxID=5210 RepID=UPI001E8D45A5|nr:uncharacterized protein HD553DRAFT_324572 [Filobasidium floriforme]KAH8083695.1 hypothetical protein HD553DRAFT_324572 [Filobasidium floriforme]